MSVDEMELLGRELEVTPWRPEASGNLARVAVSPTRAAAVEPSAGAVA